MHGESVGVHLLRIVESLKVREVNQKESNMSMSEALQAAGFSREKSTVGDRMIMEGTYKATFVEYADMPDKGYFKNSVTGHLGWRQRSNAKLPDSCGRYPLDDRPSSACSMQGGMPGSGSILKSNCQSNAPLSITLA